MELLRLEMEALEEQDFPLKITGFQEKELEKLLKGLSQKTILDPDETPELPEKATTRPGDLWILGDHRVLCGDGRRSEDLTGVLEQKPSDLVFTDLPCIADSAGGANGKRTSGDPDSRLFLLEACRLMLEVNPGPLYICTTSGGLHRLHSAFIEAGGKWSTTIIWAQNKFTPGSSDYQHEYEPILYSEGAKRFWGRNKKQSD